MADCDVAIIGGGPAGSTAAYLLAKGGARVTIVERERFPRFHIGESMLPYMKDLLQRLDLTEAMRARGFVFKSGAHFTSADGGHTVPFDFRLYLPEPYDSAWQVERADFDDMLLRHAQQRGVDVLEEHAVQDVEFGDEQLLRIRTPDGGERRLTARHVIDASGQQSFLARRFGTRVVDEELKKVALFSHFRGGKRRTGRSAGDIDLALGDGCWFWMIPLRDDVTSVGCVTNHDRWKQSGASAEDFLAARMAGTPYVHDRFRDAERVRKVHVLADYSYKSKQFVGPGWMLAGDAAAFLDPIFSTGVYLAMKTGDLAARTLLPELRRPGPVRAERLQGYERQLRRWTGEYFRLIRAFYHPGFASVFFNPRPRYQHALAPFFAGQIDLRLKHKLYLRLFYWIVQLNHRYGFVKDPRPATAMAHHA